MPRAKLEVGIIMGSILVNFLICSEMGSKVVLRLIGAILNAFCTNMGLICHILVEIQNFRKCAKIRSVSGEFFAPICVHVSRRHVHSIISFSALLENARNYPLAEGIDCIIRSKPAESIDSSSLSWTVENGSF